MPHLHAFLVHPAWTAMYKTMISCMYMLKMITSPSLTKRTRPKLTQQLGSLHIPMVNSAFNELCGLLESSTFFHHGTFLVGEQLVCSLFSHLSSVSPLPSLVYDASFVATHLPLTAPPQYLLTIWRATCTTCARHTLYVILPVLSSSCSRCASVWPSRPHTSLPLTAL